MMEQEILALTANNIEDIKKYKEELLKEPYSKEEKKALLVRYIMQLSAKNIEKDIKKAKKRINK